MVEGSRNRWGWAAAVLHLVRDAELRDENLILAAYQEKMKVLRVMASVMDPEEKVARQACVTDARDVLLRRAAAYHSAQKRIKPRMEEASSAAAATTGTTTEGQETITTTVIVKKPQRRVRKKSSGVIIKKARACRKARVDKKTGLDGTGDVDAR